MTDTLALLAALQFGDGLFPNGGFAFSNGLETLWRERRLQRHEVGAFIESQVDARWGPCDRVALAGAHSASVPHGAGRNFATLAELDAQLEALTWSASQRLGSRQAGAALLASATRIGIDGAQALRQALGSGALVGHLPVLQGALLRGAGIDATTAMAVAGHQFVAGQANAAVRLGAIGSMEAQRVVAHARRRLDRWVNRAVGPPWRCSAFNPEADIAMMRHARADTRLFST